MNFNPLISVIIPIYNKEPYLKECLDSVLSQSYKNIEVICIDDGSTDNSTSIVEEIVRKDNRVRLFKSKHGGPSAARNIGIEHSRGDYIHFMDADDGLKQGCYLHAIEAINKENVLFDLIKFYFDWSLDFDVNGHLIKEQHFIDKFGLNEYGKIKLKDDPKFIIFENHNLADKLIKRNLLLNNNLYFNNKIFYYEDGDLFYKIISYCNDICYLPYNYYCYRQSVNAQQSKLINNFETYLNSFTVYEDCSKFFFSKNQDIKIAFLKDFLNTLCINALGVFGSDKLKSCAHVIQFINNNKDNDFFAASEEIRNIVKRVKDYYFLNSRNDNFSPLISVIVPVYNVENYVEQCLLSILNQSYKNLEIICVDDESTDNSFPILNKLAKNDNRVSIYQIKHSGLSSARNYGLKYAKGDFIHFVDSDDYIKPTTYEIIYKYLSKCRDVDMVMFYQEDVYTDSTSNKINIKEYFLNNFKQAMCAHLVPNEDCDKILNLYSTNVWNKLFSSEIIKRYKLKLDDELLYYEDSDFVYKFVSRCKDIIALPFDFYCYRRNVPGQKTKTTENISNVYCQIFKVYSNSIENYKVMNKNCLYSFMHSILSIVFASYKAIYDYDARYFANKALLKFYNDNRGHRYFNETVYSFNNDIELAKFNSSSLISNQNIKQKYEEEHRKYEEEHRKYEEEHRKYEEEHRKYEEEHRKYEEERSTKEKIINSETFKTGKVIAYPFRLIKMVIKKIIKH